MEAFKIWLVAIAIVVAYGVAHDLVTTRVSLEYFTVAKDNAVDTRSPALLALAWGIGATWYIGVFFGALVALAARAGSRPKLALADLMRPASSCSPSASAHSSPASSATRSFAPAPSHSAAMSRERSIPLPMLASTPSSAPTGPTTSSASSAQQS